MSFLLSAHVGASIKERLRPRKRRRTLYSSNLAIKFRPPRN